MKLYAFWRYDFFPYVCGGEVEGWCKDDYPGKDYVMVWGGYYRKPVKIVPLAEGKRIKAELDTLKASYDRAREQLGVLYKHKLKELIDFSGIED